MRRLKTVRRPPIYPKTPGHLPCSSLTHPLPLSSRRPSVSFGGFGLSLARRRYGGDDAALYSPGTGRAAVLAQSDDQTLVVLAALGMRWKPGRTVSRRSLRGLKTLKGGASWS